MGSLGIDSPASTFTAVLLLPNLCHPNVQSTLDYVPTTRVSHSKYAQNVKGASLPRQPVALMFYSRRQ